MSAPARLEAKNFYCDAHAAYDCQCLQEFQDQLVTLTKERDHLRERLAQSEATWKGVCDHLESWLTAMRFPLHSQKKSPFQYIKKQLITLSEKSSWIKSYYSSIRLF